MSASCREEDLEPFANPIPKRSSKDRKGGTHWFPKGHASAPKASSNGTAACLHVPVHPQLRWYTASIEHPCLSPMSSCENPTLIRKRMSYRNEWAIEQVCTNAIGNPCRQQTKPKDWNLTTPGLSISRWIFALKPIASCASSSHLMTTAYHGSELAFPKQMNERQKVAQLQSKTKHNTTNSIHQMVYFWALTEFPIRWCTFWTEWRPWWSFASVTGSNHLQAP